MKRGFLNNKKAKAKSLGDDGVSATSSVGMLAPNSMQSSTNVTTDFSCLKTLSEPVVGHKFLRGIQVQANNEIYAVARIPSVSLTQSKEPSTSCIIRHSTILKITNTPGYYTPLPPLDPTDVVSKKNTPNMGVGLFAKRAFKLNQVIFSERPLVIYPGGSNYSHGAGLSDEEILKGYDSFLEENLRQALSAMPKEDVELYMNLSNCFTDSPPLQGIARTNSFGTGTDIDERNIQEGKFPYHTVGRLASRINHDCTPNVYVKFDIPTFSLQVLALKEIKAGQQLFYSYCQPHRSAKERQRQLATYGFECKCKACVNATPASDKLREEMEEKIQKLFDEKEEMLANPQFSIRSLDPLLKLEKDIEREGLDAGDQFSLLVYVILRGYHKLQNHQKHIEYYNKGKKLMG